MEATRNAATAFNPPPDSSCVYVLGPGGGPGTLYVFDREGMDGRTQAAKAVSFKRYVDEQLKRERQLMDGDERARVRRRVHNVSEIDAVEDDAFRELNSVDITDERGEVARRSFSENTASPSSGVSASKTRSLIGSTRYGRRGDWTIIHEASTWSEARAFVHSCDGAKWSSRKHGTYACVTHKDCACILKVAQRGDCIQVSKQGAHAEEVVEEEGDERWLDINGEPGTGVLPAPVTLYGANRGIKAEYKHKIKELAAQNMTPKDIEFQLHRLYWEAHAKGELPRAKQIKVTAQPRPTRLRKKQPDRVHANQCFVSSHPRRATCILRNVRRALALGVFKPSNRLSQNIVRPRRALNFWWWRGTVPMQHSESLLA